MTEVKDREFVVPGDVIVSSMEYVPGRNCFRDGESICSKRLGLVHVDNRTITVVPLSGPYVPQFKDMVIGKVEDVHTNGWFVDIDSTVSAYLPISGVKGFIKSGTDLSRIFNVDDILYTQISSCTKQGINLSMLDIRARKLFGGKLVNIQSVKVPRLIGKQGSMISLIKQKTECNISVGQNGLVWIQGDNADVVTKVVKKVEKESHLEGLTDKIEKLLEDEMKSSKKESV